MRYWRLGWERPPCQPLQLDQTGVVLDVLIQSRRDKRSAKRLLRKLLKKQMRPPRVLITDKLASYEARRSWKSFPASNIASTKD
jgi:transposase-like protein